MKKILIPAFLLIASMGFAQTNETKTTTVRVAPTTGTVDVAVPGKQHQTPDTRVKPASPDMMTVEPARTSVANTNTSSARKEKNAQRTNSVTRNKTLEKK